MPRSTRRERFASLVSPTPMTCRSPKRRNGESHAHPLAWIHDVQQREPAMQACWQELVSSAQMCTKAKLVGITLRGADTWWTLAQSSQGLIWPGAGFDRFFDEILATNLPLTRTDVATDLGDPSFASASDTGEGYAGFPLSTLEGRTVGVLSLVGIDLAKSALRYPALVKGISQQAALLLEVHAQRAARQWSESQLNGLLDMMSDAVISIDASGTIVAANPSIFALTGYQPHELVGQNVAVLMPSPERELHDAYIERYLGSRRKTVLGRRREVHVVRKDNTLFPAELTLAEVNVGDRLVFTGSLRDLSERKRLDALQAELISTVSYELRTPLTSIRGALGLLATGILGEIPSNAQEYLTIALNNCERIVHLADDIRDLEKMNGGRSPFALQNLEVRELLRDAVATHQDLATAAGVSLVVVGDLAPARVIADRERFGQVMSQLLVNAIKFSPRGAQVEIGVEASNDKVTVTVRDHGPGVTPDLQERVLARTTALDEAVAAKIESNGLGLSIAKAIAERMHGNLGFRWAQPHGSLFFLELPVSLLPTEITATSQPTVLICEDDPTSAVVIARILASAGIVGHIAPTLVQAREHLRSHSYSAITLDLTLADGEGTTLIDEVRADPKLCELPIIVVSAAAGIVGSTALSVAGVLGKPIDAVRLLACLHSALKQPADSPPAILHVEDDRTLTQSIDQLLPSHAAIEKVTTFARAREALARKTYDLVILDLSLPEGDGERLLELVGSARVLVVAAHESGADLSRRMAHAFAKSHAKEDDLRDRIVELMPRRARTGTEG